MNCEYCETKLFDTDRRCPGCGAPIKEEYSPIKKIVDPWGKENHHNMHFVTSASLIVKRQ